MAFLPCYTAGMIPRPLRVAPELTSMLADAAEALDSALGGKLRLLVLYGSRARGTAAPDSDVDLLIVLRDPSPTAEATVRGALYDVMWRHEFQFLLAPLILDETTYRGMVARSYSLARDVEQEGIVLWPRPA